jgi:hypothetical protein
MMPVHRAAAVFKVKKRLSVVKKEERPLNGAQGGFQDNHYTPKGLYNYPFFLGMSNVLTSLFRFTREIVSLHKGKSPSTKGRKEGISFKPPLNNASLFFSTVYFPPFGKSVTCLKREHLIVCITGNKAYTSRPSFYYFSLTRRKKE